MKTAIALTEKEENGTISERGARAPYFGIYDTEGSCLEIIDNPFAAGGGGAGFAAAKFLADKGVTHFIAGAIGENMAAAFEERAISHREINGSVSDALHSGE